MSIFSKIAEKYRELTYTRICNNLPEFCNYVPKLKTLERVARWVERWIWYDYNEFPLRWRSAAKSLEQRNDAGDQFGNCTEMTVLHKKAAEILGYHAENLCIFGYNEKGEKAAHAAAAFWGKGKKGVIEYGDVIYFPLNTPWDEIALSLRPEWKAARWGWYNDEAEPITPIW